MPQLQPKPEILLLYSSRFGQSRAIAEHLASHWQTAYECKPRNIETLADLPQPISAYSAVVIVASVRYGHFHKAVKRFVQKHVLELNRTVSIFVPVCLVARRLEKRLPENNSYTRKLLAKTRWQPTITAITAGALRYPLYNIVDRTAILLIMHMMKGDTDTRREYEYTDWAALDTLAQDVLKRAGARSSTQST